MNRWRLSGDRVTRWRPRSQTTSRALKDKSPDTVERLDEDYQYTTTIHNGGGDRSPRLPRDDDTVEELHEDYHEYEVQQQKIRDAKVAGKKPNVPLREHFDEVVDQRTVKDESSPSIVKAAKSPKAGEVEHLSEAYQTQAYENEPKKFKEKAEKKKKVRSASADSPSEEEVEQIDEGVRSLSVDTAKKQKSPKKSKSRQGTIEVLDEHVTEHQITAAEKLKSGLDYDTDEDTNEQLAEGMQRSPGAKISAENPLPAIPQLLSSTSTWSALNRQIFLAKSPKPEPSLTRRV